jgi:carbamoyltransferase
VVIRVEPLVQPWPAFHLHLKQPRQLSTSDDSMKGGYLGPIFLDEEITKCLEEVGAKFEVLQEDNLIRSCVGIFEEGKAVGGFQGRMEFGLPGHWEACSIIGDAISSHMQSILNLKVKFRESFRLSKYAKKWNPHVTTI